MTTAEIIQRTKETLQAAQFSLEDLRSADLRPDRRVAALHNLVVMGRAVTNVLQNLRATERDFDEWYSPYVAEMRDDELLRYFYSLRNKILKEGKDETRATVLIDYLNTSDLPKAPPNAKSFFIGDRYGGMGWIIENADGTLEKIYARLPEPSRVDASLVFGTPPKSHLGAPVHAREIAQMCALYVAYLERLVSKAEKRFREG